MRYIAYSRVRFSLFAANRYIVCWRPGELRCELYSYWEDKRSEDASCITGRKEQL